VFLTLGHDRDSGALIIESVTAFGPREKVSLCKWSPRCNTHACVQKAPHAFSDYAAYQNLSQQLAHMVRSHPRVSFQSFVVSWPNRRQTRRFLIIAYPRTFYVRMRAFSSIGARVVHEFLTGMYLQWLDSG
jgi:hypothetical protein